jgi:hypothetical protein
MIRETPAGRQSPVASKTRSIHHGDTENTEKDKGNRAEAAAVITPVTPDKAGPKGGCTLLPPRSDAWYGVGSTPTEERFVWRLGL